MQEKIALALPFDFKAHFELLAKKHGEVKAQMQQFSDEYAKKVQSGEEKASPAIFGRMQEISQKWIEIDDLAGQINLFFDGGFTSSELADFNHFLSTNNHLQEINKNLKVAIGDTNDYIKSIQDAKTKLEESGLGSAIENIHSLKEKYFKKLAAEIHTMDSMLEDFVKHRLESFDTKAFDAKVEDFVAATTQKLENLGKVAEAQALAVKKNAKATYSFYCIGGILIFILALLSFMTFNGYRTYKEKSQELTNIATELKGRISIDAQGQATLSLAKLKTTLAEDKNSIYITIKEK